MKRLIIFSWASILLGVTLVLLTNGLFSNPISRNAYLGLFALGNALLFLPNAIWLETSNRLASKVLNKPPSRFVTVSLVYIILAVMVCYGLVFLLATDDSSILTNPVWEGIVTLLFLIIFIALIASIIIISRRVLDTQEHPQIGRKSRIFMLCLCYFYIAIGMFFLAPKLKRLKEDKV